jgi:DNA-binding transcriptional LysR family regulator
MRLRYLQALRAVMETGTVTEAAARLQLTQPQISRLIGNLEDELGFQVFSRHKRRLVPTREGQQFYREATRILTGFDEISNIIRDIRRKDEPRVRIVAQSFLATTLMPPALATFLRDEPKLRYVLDVGSRADIESWFAGQSIDLGVAALPVGHERLVRSQPFAAATAVVVLPRGHRLARKPVLDAHDIADEPFVALKPYTLLRKEVDRLFAELGLHLNIRGEASSGVVACELVAQGLGVTISDPLATRLVAGDRIEIREWRPSFALTYGFLFPLGHEPASLTLKLADTIARTAHRLDPDHVALVSDVGRDRAASRRPAKRGKPGGAKR